MMLPYPKVLVLGIAETKAAVQHLSSQLMQTQGYYVPSTYVMRTIYHSLVVQHYLYHHNHLLVLIPIMRGHW